MNDTTHTRRQILRTTGLVGLGSLVGLTGTASANDKPGAKPGKGNDYGNGNGLGVWLNEPAEFRESPLWTDGVHDYTGTSSVDVTVGEMVPVEIPGFYTGPAAVGFGPKAIEVSTGTTVVWHWVEDPFEIPHNVVSLKEMGGDPVFQNPEGVVYQPGMTYERTFEEPGNYLYYCVPHGAPFPVDGPFGEAYNEFGMRGAVVVTDE